MNFSLRPWFEYRKQIPGDAGFGTRSEPLGALISSPRIIFMEEIHI
jgi:hypothetical protein